MGVARRVDILVAEDHPGNLRLFDAVFDELGAQCLRVSSHEEASFQAKAKTFALVVLSRGASACDVFELAGQIRQCEANENVALLFLSEAPFSESERQRGHRLGRVGFLEGALSHEALHNQSSIFIELFRKSREVERQARRLRDNDRHRDEFLAMLAHELRTPLAPILNAVKVMQLKQPKVGTDPMLKRAMYAADRQVHHLVRLVDGLLDASRVTAGKIELRKQMVTLQAVVDLAVQTSEPLLRERRHRLTLQMPTEPLWLCADPTRLTQVITNLLNNAARYTDSGKEILLKAEAAVGKGVEDEVRISVSDHGIGLQADMLERVFEPFSQGEQSLDRAQGGLGLGLALVRSLVSMHGGHVEAHSEGIGCGSEFVVWLPRATRPQQEGSSCEMNDVQVPPLSILLVEDNSDVRTTLRDLLELHGHRVDEAEDGPQGVEKMLAQRPNVALVDIGLPGLDGYSVAERVRRAYDNDPNERTRLIALTGYGSPEDRRRVLAAGFDAHLVKPIDVEDLSRLLKDMF
jgi:signal transduction histidine kinase/ActR/RegA family two-component response regulator